MERIKLGVRPFSNGGPGHLVFVIGPAGIGKSTYINEAEKPGCVLMKEDTYDYIDDTTHELALDFYERGRMSSTLLVLSFMDELELRRRSKIRRKKLLVIEMCALTKVAQASMFMMAQRWVDCGGTAQVFVFWPGESPYPANDAYQVYLRKLHADNPDDEKITTAWSMWEDFMNSDSPKYRLPWQNDLLGPDGGVFGNRVPKWMTWWKHADLDAAE